MPAASWITWPSVYHRRLESWPQRRRVSNRQLGRYPFHVLINVQIGNTVARDDFDWPRVPTKRFPYSIPGESSVNSMKNPPTDWTNRNKWKVGVNKSRRKYCAFRNFEGRNSVKVRAKILSAMSIVVWKLSRLFYLRSRMTITGFYRVFFCHGRLMFKQCWYHLLFSFLFK